MSFDQQNSGDFVSRQDFEVLNNQLEEKFARFEALLSRSNIFSTPKLPVNVEHPPISDTPFINPSLEPRATGPGPDPEGTVARKEKGVGKTKHGKSSKPAAAAGSASQSAVDAFTASKTVGLQVLDKPDALSVSSIKSVASTVSLDQPVHTGPQPSSASGSSVTDPPDSFVQQDPVLSDVELDPLPDRSDRDSGEEGKLSDTEVTERNEEMNHRETVRSVRAFLGWTHILDFEPAVGDTDNRSDNPWKGKHP